MVIADTNYEGQVCILIRRKSNPKGMEMVVKEGDMFRFDGVDYTVTSGKPPHNENSQGKIWATIQGSRTEVEIYPSVLNLYWKRVWESKIAQ